MTIIIQSHTYTINLDNASCFNQCDLGQTMFTMDNGRRVRITCPYDEVLKQIKNRLSSLTRSEIGSQTVPVFIELEYGVRTAENVFAQIAKVQGES